MFFYHSGDLRGNHHNLRLKTVSELVTLGTGFSSADKNNKEQVFMEGRSGSFVPTTRMAALKNKDRTVWLEQVPEYVCYIYVFTVKLYLYSR